jgi:NAD(P)-dependent dehydrogenase (short-subunit alcohol dehydrogenase family)
LPGLPLSVNRDLQADGGASLLPSLLRLVRLPDADRPERRGGRQVGGGMGKDMGQDLAGRAIVVTGGTGALGGAVIARLLAEGAICHVPSSGPDRTFRFSAEHRVLATFNLDVGDPRAADDYYASVPDLWASIHLAGGFAMAPIKEAGSAAFTEMIDANLRTAFHCSRAAAAAMVRSGTAGRIVNVAARQALEPRRGAGMVAYVAAKAAVAAMTVALAEELKGEGILVNAIAPATLDTEANRTAMPKADFGKWVPLEAAAATIAHLASPGNALTSGAILPIYGKG